MAETKPAVEPVRPPDAFVKLVNPVMRRILTSRFHGALSNYVLMLHYTGHKSGRRYDIPVGYHSIAGQLGLLTTSPWRTNFRNGRDLEVTLRGHRRPAHATLVEDPNTVASIFRTMVQKLGIKAGQRRLGIRINVNRTPTEDELADAIRHSGLSIVELHLRNHRPED